MYPATTGFGDYFELPYVNDLTAGRLGASVRFGPNTPASHLGYSMAAISNYFAQDNPRRIQSGRDWERIIDEYERMQGQQNQPEMRGTEQGPYQDQGVPGIPPRSTQRDMGIDPDSKSCSPSDIPCWLPKLFGLDSADDLMKRSGLLLLGLVLLIIGLLSLR